MKIAVIGAGAMGSVFGFFLAGAGQQVVLVNRWREHVEAINRAGLEMEEEGVTHRLRVMATMDAAEVGPVDLVLVFVKSYDTASAVDAAHRITGPETLVLTLQNGLGNAETIAATVGEERTVCGTTAHGATRLGPGRVSHRGSGETVLGPFRGPVTERIRQIAEVFNATGLRTRVTDNALGALWGKLLVNVGINALTAILSVPNGALLDHPGSRDLLSAAVSEASTVAARKGVVLPYADPLAHCVEVARATGSNHSSMLQDVLNRRRTEIDYINGAVVREGAALGIENPINETLMKLVQTIEASYTERVQ